MEALPRFNVVSLERHVREGLCALNWYDQHEELVGQADIDLTGDTLILPFQFRSAHHVDRLVSEERFELAWTSPGGADRRPAIICGHCDEPRNVMLYYKRHWACRKCHHIVHRTTNIDSDTREYMQFLNLGNIAGNPRPRYMRHDKYDEAIREHHRLARKWSAQAPRTLSGHLLYEITARYVRREDQPDWRRLLGAPPPR